MLEMSSLFYFLFSIYLVNCETYSTNKDDVIINCTDATDVTKIFSLSCFVLDDKDGLKFRREFGKVASTKPVWSDYDYQLSDNNKHLKLELTWEINAKNAMKTTDGFYIDLAHEGTLLSKVALKIEGKNFFKPKHHLQKIHFKTVIDIDTSNILPSNYSTSMIIDMRVKGLPQKRRVSSNGNVAFAEIYDFWDIVKEEALTSKDRSSNKTWIAILIVITVIVIAFVIYLHRKKSDKGNTLQSPLLIVAPTFQTTSTSPYHHTILQFASSMYEMEGDVRCNLWQINDFLAQPDMWLADNLRDVKSLVLFVTPPSSDCEIGTPLLAESAKTEKQDVHQILVELIRQRHLDSSLKMIVGYWGEKPYWLKDDKLNNMASYQLDSQFNDFSSSVMCKKLDGKFMDNVKSRFSQLLNQIRNHTKNDL